MLDRYVWLGTINLSLSPQTGFLVLIHTFTKTQLFVLCNFTSLRKESGILEGCGELLSKQSECLCTFVDTRMDTTDSPCKQVLFVWNHAMVTTSLREGEDCV